jgi:6-phosphogluconolactonase
LYASNRGHNSIAVYSVDRESGKLSLAGLYETEKNPRSFAIDPSGNYLFVAGESSNNLALYKVNKSTGALKLLQSFPVGETPSWVLALKL